MKKALSVLALVASFASLGNAADFQYVRIACDNQQDIGEDELYLRLTIDGRAFTLRGSEKGSARANPKEVKSLDSWTLSPDIVRQLSFAQTIEIELMEKDLAPSTDDMLARVTINSNDTEKSVSRQGRIDGKPYQYTIDWKLK